MQRCYLRVFQMRPIFAASPAVAAAAARGILGAYPVSQPGLAAAGPHFSLAARQAYQPQQQALLLAQPGITEQDMVTVSAATGQSWSCLYTEVCIR